MENITTPETQDPILNHEAAVASMDAETFKAVFGKTWARRQALREIEAAFDGIFYAYPGCKESANHTHAYNLLKAFQEMEEKWDSAVKHSRYSFEFELQELINKHSQENQSDTPDYVLATFITQALDAFNSATRLRDHHYDFNTWPTLEDSPLQRVPAQGATDPRPVQISGRDELRLALQIWQQDPGTCRADQNLAQDLLQLIEDGDTGDCGLNPRRSKQLANLMQEHDSCLTAMGKSVFPQLDYFLTELKSILAPIYESPLQPSDSSLPAPSSPQGAEE